MKCSEAIIITETILIRQQQRIKLFCVAEQKESLYWFCKAYSVVTKYQLANIKKGKYQYPCFVARMVMEFDDIFEENLQAFLQHKSIPSLYWESVFESLNETHRNFLLYHFFYSWRTLIRSVDVHIQQDLPICLASVIENFYSEKNTLDFLKNDFLAMTDIFYQTAKEIELEMLQEYKFPFIEFSNSIRRILLKKYINLKVIRNREQSWKTAQVYLRA